MCLTYQGRLFLSSYIKVNIWYKVVHYIKEILSSSYASTLVSLSLQ